MVSSWRNQRPAREGVQNQMNIAAKLRARRAESRNRRAVNHAIATAATPAMRDEILIMAQRQTPTLR
jgi:anti-sigma factor ChrR (cupin superfamily)